MTLGGAPTPHEGEVGYAASECGVGLLLLAM
jgi:hypothetical protein